MGKPTLVLGASENVERYSNKAVRQLLAHNHEVFAIGSKPGKINGLEIQTGTPKIEGVHTITLYLNSANQKTYYDYILSLKPKRIIFNPGAENSELALIAKENSIEPIEACTLVMLSIGNF